jgi:hypothetical protein
MTTTDITPIVIGEYDYAGWMNVTFVRSGDQIYPLTPCCQASATGSETGIACRSCYQDIEPDFARTWTLKQWTRYERTAL